jgi:hypothetical protein
MSVDTQRLNESELTAYKQLRGSRAGIEVHGAAPEDMR